MSISALALEEKSRLWEREFNFCPGEAVWIVKNNSPKEVLTRKGKIVWVGDIFICVWICSSKAPKQYGWRECFFYSDLLKGQVSIERRKTKKKGVCT